MGKFTEILAKLQALSSVQKVVAAVVTTLSLTAVGGGVVAVSSLGSGNENDANMPETEIVEDIEDFTEEETTEEETTEEETTEEETTEEDRDITVSIQSSSIFEDLKIKIVNENGKLVAGFPFEIVLTPVKVEGDQTPKAYNDHDMDGIIYLKDMKGGDYVIDLKELEGIIISKNSVKATVKGEIKYEKVEDVENEIKQDNAAEDTAQNNTVVEAVLQDTLPLIESKVIPVEVAKDKVDFSKFPSASVSSELNEIKVQQLEKRMLEVSVVMFSMQNRIGTSVNPATVVDEALPSNEVETSTTPENSTILPSSELESSAASSSSESESSTTSPSSEPESSTTPPSSEPESSTTLPSSEPESSTTPPSSEPESSTTPPSSEPESSTTPPSSEPESSTTPPSSEPESSTTPPSSTSPEGSSGTGEDSSSSEDTSGSEGEDSTEGDDGPTEETVKAIATIKLPKTVQLYAYGNDKSKSAAISLNIADDAKIVLADSMQWTISDSSIADLKIAEDKKSATLTAKKAGTAVVNVKITYKADEAGNTKTSEISCTVNVGNHTDTKTQLNSTNDELLFLDGEAKKIATPASYATAEKLYTTPKYTGWQTIDGKLYYYKADNTVATGNQVIGGVKYSFNSDGSLIVSTQTYGIDVSKWQGNIDWKAVAQSGVKFAIIRCAYRGSSDGLIHEDPYFRANIQGATQNGIKVGVYFFTQAVNEVEAIEEASMAIALVRGYNLQFPIFIDTEYATNGRANGLDVATRTRVVKAFCETVRNSGYKPGIYASKSWYYNNLDMSQLSAYNIWVAQYNTSCNYTGRYDMWQYTSTGSVPGIKGNVDLNICYTNY